MHRSILRIVVTGSILLSFSHTSVGQQQGAAPPPDVAGTAARWPNLTIADFMKDVTDRKVDASKWPAETRGAYETAIQQESARRIRAGATYTDAPLAFEKMVVWAAPALSPEEQQVARAQYLDRLRNDSEVTLEEVGAVWVLHETLGGDAEVGRNLIRDWVLSHDITSLSARKLAWCMRRLGTTNGRANAGLQVLWTGQITAPRDGEYVFSACPTEIQIRYPHLISAVFMKVFINGQIVLDAGNEGVSTQSVNLAANQPQPIRIEFAYKHSGTRVSIAHPPAAMLYWQGPGIAKQLVPPNALAPPQGKGAGPGLWGEYSYLKAPDKDGNPQPPRTAAGVDPQIDFLWTRGYDFLLRDREALNKVAQEFIRRTTSPEFVADVREKGWFSIDIDWLRLAELMTSGQRTSFLQAYARNPEFLRRVPNRTILKLIQAYRSGAELAAIDLVGSWAQANPSDLPQASTDYFVANRQIYFWIADHFTYEFKDGCVRLEDEFLELPDGSCSLPVAYIVAYSRAFRGELKPWIEALDARLAQPNLTGDQRASWLLARSQAEEIRGKAGPQQRFELFPERYHAGREYLDEASLVAESEPMKLRVFVEKLTRSVATRSGEVEAMLTGAQKTFQSAASVDKLKQLAKDIEGIQKRVVDVKKAQAKSRTDSYISQLERRKEEAEKNKDSKAVARYTALIQAAQPVASPDNP